MSSVRVRASVVAMVQTDAFSIELSQIKVSNGDSIPTYLMRGYRSPAGV